MKIHAGCGAIYLKDYVNIDAAPNYIVPDVSKDILEINTTTLDKYYKHEFCKGTGFCVADVCALLDELPFESSSVEEFVLIQVLEHIPSYKLTNVLNEINRVLKSNGKFVIGVPDIKETAQMLANAKTIEEEDWCIRLIHGTQRNQFSHHYNGFVKRTLENLLTQHGFGNFEQLPNLNFYPSVYLNAYKE